MKFYSYIKAPITGTVNFRAIQDDGADVYIDGVRYINQFSVECECDDTFSISMTEGEFYYLYIVYQEKTLDIKLELYWSYSGQAEIIIPSTAFYYPEWSGNQAYALTIACADGMALTAASPNKCVSTCGDGNEASDEGCDDDDTDNGDGCSSTCTVEAGWVCSGGSETTADTCTQCAAGYIQDDASNPENCVTDCGDGLRVGTEVCDDNDTNDSDGCSSTCTVEAGWVCDGGSSSSVDTCTQCTTGYIQDDSTTPRNCVTD
jgi:cysteine-rich repeat protein